MKIYKSTGELVTVLLLIMSAIAFFMYTIINNGMRTKYISLKNNAVMFSDAVSTNLHSLSNEKIVFLDEIIDENYLSKMKSPFSEGYCNTSESYVMIDDAGNNKVTLTCDNYMLHNYNLSSEDFVVYKISDWDTKKEKNGEKQELYSCLDPSTSNNIFGGYYDEHYLLYKINKEFGTTYYDLDDVDGNVCQVDSKSFYRKETEIVVD